MSLYLKEVYHNNNKELFNNTTSITELEEFTELISYTVPTALVLYISDISETATTDGTFKMTVDDNLVCINYYGAKQYYNCSRNVPYVIPAGSTVKVLFKPESSGADVAVNLGGFEF